MTLVNDELQVLNDRFCAALNAGDIDATMEYYAEDVSFLLAGTPALEGAGAVRDYYEKVFAAGQVSATMETKRVEEAGGLLLEHGEYTMSIQPGGAEAISDTGKYSLVLRRNEQGDWRCWFDVFQSDGSN
jgi:uncharacterized protein (TIGR02246 family)